MPFTVNEYIDLVRLLGEHPEWRAELRRLLLSEDVLELPRIVQDLAEAQARTEEQMQQLTATVRAQGEQIQQLTATVQAQGEQIQQLTATVRDLEEQMQQLTATVRAQGEQIQQLTATVRAQGEQIQQLTATVRDLTDVQKGLVDDVAELKGWALEDRYRKHAYGYFGRWLRKARAVDLIDLAAVEEAYQSGQLTDAEWEELTALDLIVQGRVGKGTEARDALIALEVSSVIDMSDVKRAHRRAELLRQLGYTTMGAVGGAIIRDQAEDHAKQLGVAVALNGRIRFWAAFAEPPASPP